ncbi:tetratricopeptide repeat protein [Paraburkholderia sediminicola]|uniref:tetratricopeptide repeat protein n=1 Tax=Paraburkholderia sediminicola TaxID=458836 RepID=UPI0038BB29D9
MQSIDISDEFLRYRHNAQAMTIFGYDISDDPAIGAAGRVGLYFSNGRSAYAVRQYPVAIQAYSRALDIQPSAAAFNNRGLAFRDGGNVDAAERDFSSALRLDPKDIHARVNLGNLMLASKRFEPAIDEFTRSVDSGDRRDDTYLSRAYALRLSGDAAKALDDYDVVIAQNPKDARGHLGKGLVFDDIGKPGAAVAEFTDALKADPTNADAMLALAMDLHDQHKYARAIAAYTSALKVRPGTAWIVEQRALAYQHMGNWVQAISDYSTAISLRPNDELLHRLRGIAYDHEGKYSGAISDFRESVELAPDSSRGYVLWARALVDAGRFAEAIGVLSRASIRMPDDISLRHELAFVFERQGAYSSAVHVYETVLRTHPEDERTRVYLADDETTLGQYEDATQNYELVSRALPEDGNMLHGRAQLAFYAGDFRRADSDLERWQDLYRRGKIEANEGQPYYVAIWRHLIALKLAIDDRARLATDAAALDAHRWPYPVLSFYLGKTSIGTLLVAASSGSTRDRENQRCEAEAYLGEWRLDRDDVEGAKRSFAAASTECPASFVEKALATRELQRMDP